MKYHLKMIKKFCVFKYGKIGKAIALHYNSIDYYFFFFKLS